MESDLSVQAAADVTASAAGLFVPPSSSLLVSAFERTEQLGVRRGSEPDPLRPAGP